MMVSHYSSLEMYISSIERFPFEINSSLDMFFQPLNERSVIVLVIAWRIRYFVEQPLCCLLQIVIGVRENKVREFGFALIDQTLEILFTFRDKDAFVLISPNP